MALHETERRESGWRCSKTALNEDDAMTLLKEFAAQKRKQRENDPDVKNMKSKYKLKASAYPSPGNILHTGRQLPRSPGPGVLPLLPSQKFETPIPAHESFELPGASSVRGLDNMVPCGRQLPRTPLSSKTEHSPVLREIQPNIREHRLSSRTQKAARTVGTPAICDPGKNNSTTAGRLSDTRQHLENENLTAEISAHKKPEIATPSTHQKCNRRISELPVKGINEMRISGVLKKMGGYECHSEDLEFLKHVQNQEKFKVLKAELACLRKDFTAAKHDRELILSKKDKIEDDIQKMKFSYERTVQLGRAFLSRTQDPGCAQSLAPEDVLKQLSQITIHNVHQQEKAKLKASQKEVARISSLLSKIESCEQCIGAAKQRNELLKNEVIALKAEIEKIEKERTELKESLQKKREQMSQCIEQQSIPPVDNEISEEDRERVNRRLQRIVYRKNLYLEREKIIQRLKRELK
ncbi:uncharacterized protein PAF06_004862 [Gastrophryne carolinensis]